MIVEIPDLESLIPSFIADFLYKLDNQLQPWFLKPVNAQLY